jgi:hypothetical protein
MMGKGGSDATVLEAGMDRPRLAAMTLATGLVIGAVASAVTATPSRGTA